MSITTIPAYPLQWPQGWPRAASRKSAKFSKTEWRGQPDARYQSQRALTIADGTGRILKELERLGIRHGEAIISTNLILRLDGLPKSGQSEPTDPGVAVYWRKDGAEMKVMAIDIYDRVAGNLGAVAATLEAMRAIERHGGAQIMERTFTGFTALPAPKSHWEKLGMNGASPDLSVDAVNDYFRRASRKAHPDVEGGSHEAMAELNTARDAALAELARRGIT